MQGTIYTINLPLSHSPLKEIHTYFIKGAERNLLIDTAFNMDDAYESLLKQMEEFGAAPENTDVFLTHMHVDHVGLIGRLHRDCNTIYASSKDRVLIDGFQAPQHGEWITLNNQLSGVPSEHALKPEEHIAHRMHPGRLVPIQEINPGDGIAYGDFNFTVVDLAGHTPGHIGLWDEDSRTLISGDHILKRVSPNITAWDMDNDYLGIYLDSLGRVKSFNVKNLYVAHGKPIENVNERIDEMLVHHEDRLNKVMEAVAEYQRDTVTSYDVAIKLEWSRSKSFFDLPQQQKWFAFTETLAHLQHLCRKGLLRSEMRDGIMYYSQIG